METKERSVGEKQFIINLRKEGKLKTEIQMKNGD